MQEQRVLLLNFHKTVTMMSHKESIINLYHTETKNLKEEQKMKKALVLLAIGGFLAIGGSMAFATEVPAETLAAGNGMALHQQGFTPEQALAAKVEKIDALVAAGRITPEQATAFKVAMTDRMSQCDGTQDRDSKDRLGVGFGRTADKGEFKGQGARNGVRTK